MGIFSRRSHVVSNVAHLINSCAAKPTKVFLSYDGFEWSYADVGRCARLVATFLRGSGIRPGDRVALLLDNGPAFVSAYFGILRLGAVAVSLSPAISGHEARALLADSGARLVFTHAAGAAGLKAAAEGAGCAVVELVADDAGRSLAGFSHDDGAPVAAVGPDHPAALVYTSGTEGVPKGVLLSHGNVCFTAAAKRRYMGVRADDRLLLFLPLHHCFGQNAVMNAAAASGAGLIIQRRFDAAQVLDAVTQQGATMFFGVPTVFSALLDLAEPSQLAGLRYYFSAAAPLPPVIEERWITRFGHPIHQGYGMTESSPFATYNHLERLKPGTVGTAIEGVEIRVVDPLTDAPLPPGAPGEVTIRGPNVMLGYWNQPEATARAVRDGWLHTGDLGRLDAEGYLTIDDRLKDIIVVGGSNVSPVEVETALCRHPAVREAAVYGVPEPYLGEEVHAAVVLRAGQTASAADILGSIRLLLPPSRHPSQLDIVEALPKAPTGKILRRVLRDRARAAATEPPAGAPAALRDWLDAWFDLRLGVRPGGLALDRPLLDYGLNSILGVALARDLTAHLGRTVPPTLVWEQPTLRALLSTCDDPLPAPT